jgi:hypothetical protein
MWDLKAVFANPGLQMWTHHAAFFLREQITKSSRTRLGFLRRHNHLLTSQFVVGSMPLVAFAAIV